MIAIVTSNQITPISVSSVPKRGFAIEFLHEFQQIRESNYLI